MKEVIANDAKVKEAMGPAALDGRMAKRLKWWLEAHFGMFIHWGIYALAEGRWKGRHFNRPGEWIMHSAKVPVREYARLAKQFNPVKFDADEWVDIARRTGGKQPRGLRKPGGQPSAPGNAALRRSLGNSGNAERYLGKQEG